MRMMKYFYVATAVSVAFFMSACSKHEGTEPGTDPYPAVTIYSLSVSDEYDSDVTVNLRIVPNGKVDKMYLYYELLEDKEAAIATDGEEAYIQYVINNGTEYSGETQEVVLEDLSGLYAISVVAVGGSSAEMYEYQFKGVVWIDGGRAYVQENIVGLYGYVTVERQSEDNVFRVVGLYTQLNEDLGDPDDRFVFTFDSSHTCTAFSTDWDPYIYIGYEDDDSLWHGYYSTTSYSAYCYVTMGTDSYDDEYVYVSCLALDNNASLLYSGGYIAMWTDELTWYE